MGNEFSGLSDRKKLILKAIIDAHIRGGEPVGSKYLTQNLPISISSATIRNEMSELEEMGFLEQPHTSAGRVPSEYGYRFYVDSLMQKYRMSQNELMRMNALVKSRLAEVDRLLETVISYLPEGPCYYPEDMVTDQPERAIMAEIVREKVLECTSDEIPHAVAVEMLEVKERLDGTVYANAVIYTERESQKGILIGKRGDMLKKIGRLARIEMERTLGSKFYLELWVKVNRDWRNNIYKIRTFGLSDVE